MRRTDTKAKGTIGIIGGMGPLATAHFLSRIVSLTKASRDQEHVPIVAVSIPQVPDRTEAIMAGERSPEYNRVRSTLASSLDVLMGSGVSCVAMPCNTAHEWWGSLALISKVPFLNMPQIALKARELREASSICVFGTRGVRSSGIFERANLSSAAICYPDENGQSELSDIISAIKSGENPSSHAKKLQKMLIDCRERGSVPLIACTELSCTTPFLKGTDLRVDSLDELAKEAIVKAGFEVKGAS